MCVLVPPIKQLHVRQPKQPGTVWYESEAYGIRRDAKEGLYKALVELALIPAI